MVRQVHTLLQQHYDEDIGQVGLYFPENGQSLKRRNYRLISWFRHSSGFAQKTPFKLKCVVY